MCVIVNLRSCHAHVYAWNPEFLNDFTLGSILEFDFIMD